MRLDEGLEDQRLALDITPLIDIIFLLVLFFAVSTSFISGEDLAALQTDVVTLGEVREELTEEVQRKAEEVDRKAEEVERKTEEVARKDAQISTLQTDFTRMVEEKTAELRQLAEQLERTEGSAAQLEFMVTALETEKVTLQERLDTRDARNTSLQQQLERAYQDFQNLNAELTAVRSEAEQRAEQERLLRGLIAEREAEREQLRGRSGQLEAEQQTLLQEQTALAGQLQTLRGFLDQREAEHDEQRSQLVAARQDLAAQLEDTRRAVEALTGELAAREIELQGSRNTLDQAAAQEVLLQKLLAEKAAELDGMRVRIEDADAARNDLRSELESAEVARTGLQSELEAAAAARTGLQSELATTREQSAASAEALRAEARGLQTQVLRLQAELNKYREVADLDREQIERILLAQQQLSEGMSSYLADNSLDIQRDQQRLTLQLSDQVLFDSGSPTIKGQGLEVLRNLGRILKERSEQLDIQIGGHTDNIPIAGRSGPLANNWGLSAARAVNVVRFFEDEVGMDPDRMSAVGYGEHRPVADNSTSEGRAQNRRIEIVLLPR